MADQEPSPPAPAPSGAVASGTLSALRPRARRWVRSTLLLLGPFVALTVGAYVYYTSGRVVETDNAYVKADVAIVSAEIAGPITAVGVRENYHLGFDVLLYVLPKGGKKWLRMISDLVAFAFGVGMIWYGGQLIGLTWNTTLPSLCSVGPSGQPKPVATSSGFPGLFI